MIKSKKSITFVPLTSLLSSLLASMVRTLVIVTLIDCYPLRSCLIMVTSPEGCLDTGVDRRRMLIACIPDILSG